MYNCAAIVLAAGMSTRMGDTNKLLIEIDGTPMIRRTVMTAIATCDAPVTVVTGHQSDLIKAALSGLPVTFVFNPNYAKGQKTSVACGLNASPEAESTLVVLGDQPRLTPQHLSWLLAQQNAAKITIPICGENRGNPIVVPHTLMPRLLADKQNPGCYMFTRQSPDLVKFVETDQHAFFQDIDTPKDLDNLTQQEELTP